MDKLIKHLEFLQASSEKTCNYLSDKEINTIPFFCLGLLKRIQDTTTSTKALFEILLQNQKHGFSIGLLLRALIFDSLISMNLMRLINDGEAQGKNTNEIEEAVKKYCNTILSDGLNLTLSYIKDAEMSGLSTAEETAQTCKSMRNLYKPFFEIYQDDGTIPKLEFIKQKKEKISLENLAKNSDLKKISEIYDIYTYLSKYEHFGIIYYNAINEDLDSKLDIFSKAVKAFVGHNSILHWILAQYSENDTFIKEQSRLTNDYLLNNVINNNY